MPQNQIHIKQVENLTAQLSKSLSDVMSVGNTASNNLLMGTHSIGMGTSTPDETLHLVGSFKYIDGTEADGFLLVSDASGVASWTASSGVSAFNDLSDVIITSATTNDTLRYNGSAWINTSDVTIDSTGTMSISGGLNVSGSVIINESGLSTTDLRIEGDSETNLLFTDASLNRVGIGASTLLARLHIIGEGSSSGTSALLIENSSNVDLLQIQDDGSLIFNNTGLSTADFRIEGDAETSLFATDAGTDTVGIGTIPSSTIKFHVQLTNEGTRTSGITVAASNIGTNGTGINITTAANAGETRGLYSSVSRSTGLARGVYGDAINPNTVTNYGIYGRARNGSSSSIAVYGEVGGDSVDPSLYTVGVRGGNGSTTATDKRAGFFNTLSSVDNGIAYGVYIDSTSGGNDSTQYGLFSNVNPPGSSTGVTIISGYFNSDPAGSGSTQYGIIVPNTDNKSGFGTITPVAMLEISGGQFFIAQDTDTVGATSVSIDFDQGNNKLIDLQPASATVSVTLTNPNSGGQYTIKVLQGSGGHNLTWESSVLWPGGTAPTITGTDNAIDVIKLYYDGTNYLATFDQAFA